MRNLIWLSFALIVLSSATCRKGTGSSGPVSVDSMQIIRTGGIVGFHDHYIIANGQVRKISGDSAIVLSTAKYEQVKGLLNTLPARMLSENGRIYGDQMVIDGMDHTIIAYRKNNQYEWVIKENAPDYIQPVMEKLNAAFNDLR